MCIFDEFFGPELKQTETLDFGEDTDIFLKENVDGGVDVKILATIGGEVKELFVVSLHPKIGVSLHRLFPSHGQGGIIPLDKDQLPKLVDYHDFRWQRHEISEEERDEEEIPF